MRPALLVPRRTHPPMSSALTDFELSDSLFPIYPSPTVEVLEETRSLFGSELTGPSPLTAKTSGPLCPPLRV